MDSPAIPNVFNPKCVSRLLLERVANKWALLVIYALQERTVRYADLQRRIGGISEKMLSQTLRALERDGLIQRTVHPSVPPKVEYRLTPLGESLHEPLAAICRWSEAHALELLRNEEPPPPAG